MVENPMNAVNRGVYIRDNLPFRKGTPNKPVDDSFNHTNLACPNPEAPRKQIQRSLSFPRGQR